jgi:hypothetical protein
MSFHRAYEVLTTFHQMFPHVLISTVKLEMVSVQGVDLSSSTRFLDGKSIEDRSEHFAVEIKTLALQLEVFHTLVCLCLLTHVVSEAPLLTASKVG